MLVLVGVLFFCATIGPSKSVYTRRPHAPCFTVSLEICWVVHCAASALEAKAAESSFCGGGVQSLLWLPQRACAILWTLDDGGGERGEAKVKRARARNTYGFGLYCRHGGHNPRHLIYSLGGGGGLSPSCVCVWVCDVPRARCNLPVAVNLQQRAYTSIPDKKEDRRLLAPVLTHVQTETKLLKFTGSRIVLCDAGHG